MSFNTYCSLKCHIQHVIQSFRKEYHKIGKKYWPENLGKFHTVKWSWLVFFLLISCYWGVFLLLLILFLHIHSGDFRSMFEKCMKNIVKTVKFLIKMRVTDSHFTYFASANQLPGFSISETFICYSSKYWLLKSGIWALKFHHCNLFQKLIFFKQSYQLGFSLPIFCLNVLAKIRSEKNNDNLFKKYVHKFWYTTNKRRKFLEHKT